jgi:hypothetical protein
MTDAEWGRERRATYLLREEGLSRPLSIDETVWPEDTSPLSATLALFSVLRGTVPSGPPTYFLPLDIIDEGAGQLLGYDVADLAMTSGLTNCGYTQIEKSQIQQVWAMRLNRFHLFDSRDDADRFRALTDRRVPEHAPFLVFGVYEFVPTNEVAVRSSRSLRTRPAK